MKKLVTVTIAVALLLAPSADAKTKMVRLGTDPSNDAPASLDVVYLDVGRAGKNLEIRIGIAGMLPEVRSIPEVPGIEWIFDVGSRTFVAEAVPGRTPRFFLFEFVDGVYQQLPNPQGTFEPADGYASVLVPLATIGAARGSHITGHKPLGTADVDSHVHAGPQTIYPDTMVTTKHYVVP